MCSREEGHGKLSLRIVHVQMNTGMVHNAVVWPSCSSTVQRISNFVKKNLNQEKTVAYIIPCTHKSTGANILAAIVIGRLVICVFLRFATHVFSFSPVC